MLTIEKILAAKRKMGLECEDVIVRFADHPSVHPDFRGKKFVATPFQREEEQPAWVYRPKPITLNFPKQQK